MIEYIDRQRILCAVVLEVKNQRLRVLSENNRELNLSAGRLSHRDRIRLDLSMGRLRLVASLKEIAGRRQALVEGVDVEELWEVLSSEQEWIDLSTMTAFCFPRQVDGDHESAVVRAFFRNRLYFKFNVDRFFPFTEQQVQRAAAQAAYEARRLRLVDLGGGWLRRLRESADAACDLDADERAACIEALRSYYLYEKEGPHVQLAKSMLTRAGIGGADGLFPLLVRMGVFAEDENVELLRLEVPTAFPADILARVDRLPGPPSAGALRRDLTDLPLITIDGLATQDFDDALSVEALGDATRVGIHIVDVGHFVPRDDPIDAQARARGSSIYLPDLKIPMLPPPLAEDRCSLRAGQVRPAISVMGLIDSQAQVRDLEIFPSLVKVRHQLTYYDANLMMDENRDLARLRDLAVAFRRQRLDDGAVQITLPDTGVWLDDSGQISVSRINRESPARMLVAELMIMANWLMARFLTAKGLAAVYRTQGEPRERLFRGDEGSLFQNVMQRRLLSRFILGPAAERHVGLGLDAYVTATSPIRKYFDLVTQRQLRAALGLETPYAVEEIAAVIADLQQPMSHVAMLQRSRSRYWLLKYLEGRIGAKEEALVLFKRRHGYRIILTEYLIECDLPGTSGIELSTEAVVQVTLQHVSARRDILTVFLG